MFMARYTASGNDTSPISHPIIALAQYDTIAGLYRIPEGYITLTQHFNGGFIVLSFAIAFVGSLCTLELLIRRTTNSGWRNQVLLGSAGITFGAVSTFAMHFIFNNSLSLHHPLRTEKLYPVIYLTYDPGFTVLSLVASCTAMTIAFFVMGTHLHDWYCVPGRRRGGSSSSQSSSRSSSRHGADDYGKWKSSQKKALRRGTAGVGALLQQAGAVAKWSLMDTVDEIEKQDWKPGMCEIRGKGQKGEEKEIDDDEDGIIKRDQKLEELDFRLGSSAVNIELERRQASNEVSAANSPTFRASSIRLMPSNSSLPQSSLPVLYPPRSRHSSPQTQIEPMPFPPQSNEVFTQGFNFPPHVEVEPSALTVSLIPKNTPSANSVSIWRPGSPQMGDSSSGRLPDMSQRRASLPTASLSSVRPEPSIYRNANTLTRIQSLPEADSEPPVMVRAVSDEKRSAKRMSDPKVSAVDQIDALEDPVKPPDQRRVRIIGKPVVNKLERFLGFDAVTTADIIKVFLTGTIAGFGVASMREFLVSP